MNKFIFLFESNGTLKNLRFSMEPTIRFFPLGYSIRTIVDRILERIQNDFFYYYVVLPLDFGKHSNRQHVTESASNP